MNKKYTMNESRAMIGSGSGLYSDYEQADSLFALLAPLIKVPFIKSSVSEVEIKVACADDVTKINGITSLEASEADIYLHRDIIKRLEKLNGKTLNLISMLKDFSGYKYSGTITYTPSEVEMDGAVQGTVKITPVTKPEFIENCYSIVKPTAQFKSALESVIELAETTSTVENNIEMKYEDTTFAATTSDASVATATVTGGKLTITGKKEGSAIVTLTSQGEGYATWETSSLIIVPKATVVKTSNPAK